MSRFEVLEGSRSVGNRQKGSRQKNIGLPIALCQLLTLRTGLEKIADRPIILHLVVGGFCGWNGLRRCSFCLAGSENLYMGGHGFGKPAPVAQLQTRGG